MPPEFRASRIVSSQTTIIEVSMTVSAAYAPLTYNGNSATVAFAVSWPFFTGSLLVTAISATGVETVQTLGTHYSVAGGTDANGLPATGTVTMVTAPATGTQLRIDRVTPRTQSTTYNTNDAFPAKTIEGALDRALLLSQEVDATVAGVTVMRRINSGTPDYWNAAGVTVQGLPTAVQSDQAPNLGQVQSLISAAALPAFSGTLTDALAAPRHGTSAAGLKYAGSTALVLSLVDGDRMRINGVLYAIPAGGIAGLANTGVFVNGTGGQNLAASTLYYVYVFDNAGTVTADFSTTAYAISSTAGNIGTAIKSGNDTRSLVGMIRTNGSSQFVDSEAQRFVRSWANRRRAQTRNAFTADRSWTGTSYAEVNTEIRNEFLIWSDETVALATSGTVSAATQAGYVGVSIDGAAPIAESLFLAGTTAPPGASVTTSALADGYHYATIVGKVLSGGTGSYYGTSGNSVGRLSAVIG
jgi:hypothetical protein